MRGSRGKSFTCVIGASPERCEFQIFLGKKFETHNAGASPFERWLSIGGFARAFRLPVRSKLRTAPIIAEESAVSVEVSLAAWRGVVHQSKAMDGLAPATWWPWMACRERQGNHTTSRGAPSNRRGDLQAATPHQRKRPRTKRGLFCF